MAPANVTATPTTAHSITISWNGVAGASGYVVLKGIGSGNERNLTSTFPPTVTTLLDDNDVPNTLYCYTVRAVVGGVASPQSAESCTMTLPGPQPPATVQAFATSSTAIALSWSAVAGASRYALFEAVGAGPFNSIGSVDASVLSFSVEGLTPGVTYSFEIETVIPVALFSPPSTPVSASTLNQDLEGYYRFDEKTGATAIDASTAKRDGTLLGGAVLSTTDSAPLKDDTDHNPSSASFPTTTANITAPASVGFAGGDSSLSMWIKLPAAPSGPLSIIGRRAPGCGAIAWLLGQDGTNGLNFEATSITGFGRTLAVGTWTQVGVVQHGSLIKLYVNGTLTVTSSVFSAGTAGSAPLQLGDVGGCGNGGAFLADELKLFSRALSDAEMAALGTAPPAPTNLTVTETHSTFIKFTWTAVPGADHYLVFKGTAPGNEVFFTSNPTTTFVADHLAPNQSTSWQVVAIRGGLLSLPSSELLANAGPPPSPPTGLTATLDACCTPQRVNLSWNQVTGATQYSLLQSTSGGPFVSIGSTLAPVTTFQVANLASGTSYAFAVATKDDAGTLGPPSAPVSVTVP